VTEPILTCASSGPDRIVAAFADHLAANCQRYVDSWSERLIPRPEDVGGHIGSEEYGVVDDA